MLQHWNSMEFVGSFAAMFFSSGQCLVILQLHAVQLGQYFFGIPCSLTFPMLILTLMNWWSNRWKNSQYHTAGACLKWFYAAHQVFKANCMHQSLFCCSLELSLVFGKGLSKGPADRSNHKNCHKIPVSTTFLAKMAEKWWLRHRRITLHAVQLGQYFFEFPAAWPFHVDLDIDELVVKPMEK